MRALLAVIAATTVAHADPRVLHRCKQVYLLDADADFVYGLSGLKIVKLPRGGGELAPIAKAGTAVALAVGDRDVYWLERPKNGWIGLRRVAKAGGGDVAVAELDEASALAVDGTTVFVRGGAKIVAVAGGKVTTIVTGIHDRVGAIAADDRWLYWTDGEGIHRAAKAGGKPELVAAANPNGSALLVDGERIYWAEAGKIVAAPTRVPGKLGVLATGKAEIAAIAQDATHVYWIAQDEVKATDDVLRVAKRGGSVEPVALGELGHSGGPMNELVVDGGGVTIATLDGRVLVYPKVGTAKRPAVKPDRCE